MTASPSSLPPHHWPDFPAGLVWLVGAGPGDPGLLTLLGYHALRQADVIVHDALVDPRILEWRQSGTTVEFAGKRGGKPSPQQRDITLRLIELAREGKRVLRLKGGDPFVFGRGGEEVQALTEAGVPVRVTPGISAGIGGLASAGIPVTHRDVNQVVTFLTGHDQRGEAPNQIDWAAIAKGSPVIVIYMAMKHLARISAALLAAGRDPDEPLAIVSNATLPQMRVLETTLGRAAEEAEAAGMEAPSIVCLGRVVEFRRLIATVGAAAPRQERP
jgi:uroporphyrin-III C-methyltransferase